MSDIPNGCVKPSFKIGDVCVCDAQASFRVGEPFKIIGISAMLIHQQSKKIRYVYIQQFEDGVVDSIPIVSEKIWMMSKVL